MSSFAQVIDAFRQAPNTVEMGPKFEQLMVRYFELDPTLSREYVAVAHDVATLLSENSRTRNRC